MPALRNWSRVSSGSTFEALVTTLVYFEDSKAALFGRRGKDGGQDVRSGDNTCVFQAKYHEKPSTTKVISDAKKEAKKIEKYRSSKNNRYRQWKEATQWYLVTNASFNPTDRQKWDEEVVPLFKKMGLTANYWGQPHLDGLLDKHPEVDRSFFGNQTRAFLTLPEIRERLPQQEPFLKRSSLTKFVGRKNECKSIIEFLSSEQLFLVVHGAGGVGKTRLLIEAGEETAAKGSWQVLWANVASMESSGTWFEAIVPERSTLLLIDEPENEKLLQILTEQLGGLVGRTAKWKVAITIRSPKDPVLRFLRSPRMIQQVLELTVDPLPNVDAETICSNLFDSGPLKNKPVTWKNNAARDLAIRFSQYPVWLTLAVHVLEIHGDLSQVPENADKLADNYMGEVVTQQNQFPPEQVLSLLRWIALIGTLNREDASVIKLLADQSEITDESQVKGLLEKLVTRRALIQRGANDRLVELKPDVLRDHVLRHWLSVNVGYGDEPIQPSVAVMSLTHSIVEALLRGNINSVGRSILISLARIEMLLKLAGNRVPLLNPFFEGIHNSLEKTSASIRVLITEVLSDVAFFRPAEMVRLSQALRSSSVVPETIKGLLRSHEVNQDDVILELAWLIFCAAMGSQMPVEKKQILDELCALTELEVEIGSRRARGLPNDGKRAKQLVKRVLEGGPQFWGDFDKAVQDIALNLLDQITSGSLSAARIEMLGALLIPAATLERRQTWSDNNAVHFQSYILPLDHPTRGLILKRIKELISNDAVSIDTRVVLWNIFSEAHRSVNQCRLQNVKNRQEEIKKELSDNLSWTEAVLKERDTGLKELEAARRLWDWHYRFEKNSDLKEISNRLETLYTNNDIAREFEELISKDDWTQKNLREDTKATELSRSKTIEDIKSFLQRATLFFGNENELNRVSQVAFFLGKKATESEVVRLFVRDVLALSESSTELNFAIDAAAGWVFDLRKKVNIEKAYDTVIELINLCSSDEKKIYLLWRFYGGPIHPSISEITTREHDYLRSLKPIFLKHNDSPSYISIIGWTMFYDWPSFKLLVEQTLDETPQKQIAVALKALTEGISGTVRQSTYNADLPADLGLWFFNQLLRIPDFNNINDIQSYQIQEILKHVGSLPIEWLPQALQCRYSMEERKDYENVRGLSSHIRLSSYVTQITSTQVNEAKIVKAIKDLVDLIPNKGSIGYYLPELLRDIDPQGLCVPHELTRRIETLRSKEEIYNFAKVAGAYSIGGVSWRIIAKPVIQFANTLNESDCQSLFSSLMDHGSKSWSGTPGEVPHLFLSNVEHARRFLDSESDPIFRPFWEWHLKTAESELRWWEEHAKEERGE